MRLKLILKTRFIKVMITDKFKSHIHVVLGGEMAGGVRKNPTQTLYRGRGGDVK